MDTSLLVNNLVQMARIAAPLLPFGQVGIVAARAALDAFRLARETMALSSEQMAQLDTEREALELAVNDHSKRVADRLAG